MFGVVPVFHHLPHGGCHAARVGMSAGTAAPPAATCRGAEGVVEAVLVPTRFDQWIHHLRAPGAENALCGFVPLLLDFRLGCDAVGNGEVNHFIITPHPKAEILGSIGHVGEGALVGPAQNGRKHGVA